MNGRKSKQLRREAKRLLPQAPEKAYEKLSHKPKPMPTGKVNALTGAPETVLVAPTQVMLVAQCQRAVYKALKGA